MTTAKPTSSAHSTPAPRPGRTVLGPLSVVLVLGAALVVAAAGSTGRPAVLGVAVGTLLVASVFAFGAVVVGVVARVSPSASLLVALLTYTLQIVAVGLVYVALSNGGALDGSVDARWLSGAVIAGTLAWMAAQIVVTVRSRQPVYELPSQGAEASVR